MLSPEIWNFKPPLHHTLVFSGSSNSYNNISTEIANRYFNHSVTVVLPETVLVPEDLDLALTKDGDYYKVNNLSTNTFLNKQFIDSFIKSGELYALSIGTQIDTDDCAAVTPCGHLVLNLLKETYQTLGLEGTQSSYSTERYVVKIDLKHSSFTPGKKIYERAVRCLTEFVDLKMDFLIAWEPPAVTEDKRLICPSSVAAYLSELGHEVSGVSPRVSSTRQYNAKLPATGDMDHHELLEWMGAVSLGVNMSPEDAEGMYLSTFSGPLGETRETQVSVLNFHGFFTPTQIKRYFQIFSLYVERRQDLPWAGLHVQGFSDSPVSCGLHEHTFHSDGDNHYTVVLRPDRTFLLFKTNTFVKKMKLKLS